MVGCLEEDKLLSANDGRYTINQQWHVDNTEKNNDSEEELCR